MQESQVDGFIGARMRGYRRCGTRFADRGTAYRRTENGVSLIKLDSRLDNAWYYED